jgi:hypothetical protein
MALLNTLGPSFISGSLAQLSLVDLVIPGFTNATSTASQALTGNLAGYYHLMCLFALVAFLKPYALQLKDWFIDYCS